MSSPTETTPLPEPLPAGLKVQLECDKALVELDDLVGRSFWNWDCWRDYSTFWILAILYGYIVLHDHDPALLFCGMLVLMGTLHDAGERRARRRLQLLLTVIRGLERRDAAAGRP